MKESCTYRKQSDAFGPWLLAEIEARGMTLTSFGGLVGASTTTVWRWVHGRKPAGKYIRPIARALELEYDDVSERAGYRPSLPRDELEEIHVLLDEHLVKLVGDEEGIRHIVDIVKVFATSRSANRQRSDLQPVAEDESPYGPTTSKAPVRPASEQ